MRTRRNESAGFPAGAAMGGHLFHSLAACFLLYMTIMTTVYAETKSVTVTFGSHAYQTFKTTQAGETHGLNINKAAAAPNIARSLITAQDTQDAVLWKPARITTAAQTHSYIMTGTKLNEPLWVEIEGEFVKGTGGTGTGVAKPDFEVTVYNVNIMFSDPDSSEWNELDEKQVVLHNQQTRIKLSITPKAPNLQAVGIFPETPVVRMYIIHEERGIIGQDRVAIQKPHTLPTRGDFPQRRAVFLDMNAVPVRILPPGPGKNCHKQDDSFRHRFCHRRQERVRRRLELGQVPSLVEIVGSIGY
jgi:hypothetical protein